MNRRSVKKRHIILGLLACAFVYQLVTVKSWSPFCRVGFWGQMDAVVEVNGKRYTSTVLHKQSMSRKWISIMNSAGCKQKCGGTFVFKTDNNRIILLKAKPCYNTNKRMKSRKTNNILEICESDYERRTGYVVDSGTNPKYWRKLRPSEMRIVSITAKHMRGLTQDELKAKAPAFLRFEFDYSNSKWGDSPESVLAYSRLSDTPHDERGRIMEGRVPLK